MTEKKSPPPALIQSVQRAVAVLRSFSERDPELTVTELSRRLNLHKSTVSRILSTLQYDGLVSQNPDNGKYRLGVGLVSLAGVALGRLTVRSVAHPLLPGLSELTEETVDVTTLDGNDCVTIDRVPSPKPIRYVGWLGRRTPLHCTASGKVLLAFMSDAERRERLPLPLPSFTDKTMTDPEALFVDLQHIRQSGYAIVHEEYEEGYSAIAAPIFDHQEQVAGALAISGPSFRLDEETMCSFVDPLLQYARRISAELGYQFMPQPT